MSRSSSWSGRAPARALVCAAISVIAPAAHAEEPPAPPGPVAPTPVEPAPVEPAAPVAPAPVAPAPAPLPAAPAPVAPAPVAAAPSPTPAAPDPAPPPRGRRYMLGYRAYNGSFLEVTYGFEAAPWATPDGAGDVALGGLRFYEHRGSMINTLTAVLGAVGAAGTTMTPTYTDASGRTWVNKAAEDKAHEEYTRKLFEGAATRPFSLELRGYHDSMGSEMDGVSVALQRTTGTPTGMSGWGVVGGRLETNRNYAPPAMATETSFTRWWAGITYERRRVLVHRHAYVIGLHGGALLALGNPWLALVNVGPELLVTDRLHVRVAATSELHRFDASAGIGWRGELGVRF